MYRVGQIYLNENWASEAPDKTQRKIEIPHQIQRRGAESTTTVYSI